MTVSNKPEGCLMSIIVRRYRSKPEYPVTINKVYYDHWMDVNTGKLYKWDKEKKSWCEVHQLLISSHSFI